MVVNVALKDMRCERLLKSRNAYCERMPVKMQNVIVVKLEIVDAVDMLTVTHLNCA